MHIVRVSKVTLALGSIGVGAWGLLAPRQLARLMGDNPVLARPLAVRDAMIGIALLRSSGAAPLCIRALAAFSDAVRLRNRSPMAAAGALGFGVWSLATVVLGFGTPKGRPH
jgi:hypothetical protein